MSIGSFFAGMFLGRTHSSTHNHHTTIVHNPINYPEDWDNYTNEKKLEWLKNRSYWREYHQLRHSLSERVEFKQVEGDNIIYCEVMSSIIKNEGDKTEANQLFTEYLNKKYMTKPLNSNTEAEIKMEIDRMNDYVQNNRYLLSHFHKPVEYYYFNMVIVR